MNDQRGHDFVWNTALALGVCKNCLLTFPNFAIDEGTIPECSGRPVPKDKREETFPTSPEDWRRSVT